MFYLDHRLSYDLDLFTTQSVDSQQLRNQLLRLAGAIGANCESLQTTPDFHRFILRRGDEREVLDFVVDRIPQIDDVKERIGGIRVDTLTEIIANKWAALIGRMELKDLIDLFFIEREGHDVLSHLASAARKDAGFEAATLSHLLNSVRLDSEPKVMIIKLDLDEFRAFVERIRRELAHRALPQEP